MLHVELKWILFEFWAICYLQIIFELHAMHFLQYYFQSFVVGVNNGFFTDIPHSSAWTLPVFHPWGFFYLFPILLSFSLLCHPSKSSPVNTYYGTFYPPIRLPKTPRYTFLWMEGALWVLKTIGCNLFWTTHTPVYSIPANLFLGFQTPKYGRRVKFILLFCLNWTGRFSK